MSFGLCDGVTRPLRATLTDPLSLTAGADDRAFIMACDACRVGVFLRRRPGAFMRPTGQHSNDGKGEANQGGFHGLSFRGKALICIIWGRW